MFATTSCLLRTQFARKTRRDNRCNFDDKHLTCPLRIAADPSPEIDICEAKLRRAAIINAP